MVHLVTLALVIAGAAYRTLQHAARVIRSGEPVEQPRHLNHQLGAGDANAELHRLIAQYYAEHPDELVTSKHRAPGDPNRIDYEPDTERTDGQLVEQRRWSPSGFFDIV